VERLDKSCDAGHKIWIVNHYASCPDYPNEHRHFDIARELVKRGHEVTIIAASTMHNMGVNLIEDGSPVLEKFYDGVRYLFLKARSYEGNGFLRILNMRDFLKGFRRIARNLPKPEVIIASSPHLPSLNAALDVADEMDVPCICEVRDLWPQSLVEYGYLPGWDPLSHKLYRDERRAYERATALIFTMEGGADYIQDKGWDIGSGGQIDLSKVHHINNGVDLEAFRDDEKNHACALSELNDCRKIKIVYTGSMRAVNNVGYMIEVAQEMKKDDVAFIMVGGGDELDKLRAAVCDRGLDNIFFLGSVAKCDIPGILKEADLLLVAFSSENSIAKYGMSLNKLFDYLASGKPLLSNLPPCYSIIEKHDCGIERSFSSPGEFAEQIRQMISDKDSLKRWGENSRATAELYSFVSHANHLIEIIEGITKEEQ